MRTGIGIFGCVATSCENVYVLYVMCMVLSIASFTYRTTVNAYVPDICGDMDLKAANTIESLAGNVSMVIAPVLAGICIEWNGYGLSTNIPVCIAFNFVGGIANTIYSIYYRSLIQAGTTPERRGKVFTFQSTLVKVISMIVVFLAGVFADIYSVRLSIILSGIFTVMIAVACSKMLKKER